MTDPLAPLVQSAEAAAIPTAIAGLQAFKQFEADMGIDPAKWALNYPGAKLKFLGTLGLQLPVLAQAEGSALQASTNTVVDGFIATLQAKQAQLSAPSGQASATGAIPTLKTS